jgi:nijmegen breakage syndrome protein 1
VQSRFKGFDDDDDAPTNLNSIPEAPALDQAPVEESQGLFVSQDPEMDVDHDESHHRRAQTRSSRKRTTPPMQFEEEEEEDFIDKLAPAAAAMKKRRLAEQAERRRRGEATPPVESVSESAEPETQAPKQVKKEIDVLEIARSKREQAEELARKEREALQEALDGMDIEAIRNLAIIEEMEVTRQPPPQRASREDESDRWDDRWNGRKNFKKFRRRGEAGNRARDFRRVIVALEEVKKKDFGIGDDYWLENDNQRRKKKDKGQETQGAFASQSPPRPKTGATTRAAEMLADEIGEVQAEEEADDLLSSDLEVLEQPPELVVASRSQRSQRTGANTSRKPPANNKRPASTNLTKPAPAKKARQTRASRKEESDDSDDEHKFRFRD